MVKMSGIYQGEKHCEFTHGPSMSRLETDAPKDNNGKGERFSPTDLMGAALGSCMLTVMAIAAENEGISLKGARVEIAKEMMANPRRISRLPATIHMPPGVPQERRDWLERIAHTCPVRQSLRADLETPLEIVYPD